MNNESSLNSYFNDEVNTKISDMSNQDMTAMLKELEGTAFWTAILKYGQGRAEVARNGLYSLDPIKEPAQICRLQGMVSGIYDLIDAVISLKNKADEKNEGKNVNENE